MTMKNCHKITLVKLLITQLKLNKGGDVMSHPNLFTRYHTLEDFLSAHRSALQKWNAAETEKAQKFIDAKLKKIQKAANKSKKPVRPTKKRATMQSYWWIGQNIQWNQEY
ncbi:hypothetical protein PSHT_04423 [Puccinia striiformis]|nr:hypothetical protein PSHT_04423 [Puccinia striiformis]